MPPRIEAIKSLLASMSPTIIALQEVTVESFSVLFRFLTKAGYFCNYKREQNFQPSNGYGVCIFSLIPIVEAEIVPFHVTQMGRYFVRVLLANGTYVVTTHLESLPQFASIRNSQIRQILAHCATTNAPHIWTMDSNITPNERDTFPSQTGQSPQTRWMDCFELAGSPSSEAFTYDAAKNKNILDNYRSRLDRIYIRSAAGVHLTDFRLAGTRNMPNANTPPSDHYAVFCAIKKN